MSDNPEKYRYRLSLYLKAKKGLNIPMLYELLKDSAGENIIDTFIIVMNLRDCRGGKGERKLGRYALVWLFINYPKEFNKIYPYIPVYGRWDDLFEFFPNKLNLDASNLDHIRVNYNSTLLNPDILQNLCTLQRDIVMFLTNQLMNDRINMLKGDKVSLCAKWMPTERSKKDISGLFRSIANIMNISPKELRKLYNTPLRKYINIIENNLRKRDYNNILFDQVPNSAFKKYEKCLKQNDNKRYVDWSCIRRNKPEKITTIKPYEIVKYMRFNQNNDNIQHYWKSLILNMRNLGYLKNTIVIVDTSASMYSQNFFPLDISLTMGLLASELNYGIFKNIVINFHSVPKIITLPEDDLVLRYSVISQAEWSGNLNIKSVYKLIVNHAIENKVHPNDSPSNILIMTDKYIDTISLKLKDKSIQDLYLLNNYKIPNIRCWNIKGNLDDEPIIHSETNTIINGFSDNIFTSVLENKPLGAESIISEVLSNVRYTPIRTLLSA